MTETKRQQSSAYCKAVKSQLGEHCLSRINTYLDRHSERSQQIRNSECTGIAEMNSRPKGKSDGRFRSENSLVSFTQGLRI